MTLRLKHVSRLSPAFPWPKSHLLHSQDLGSSSKFCHMLRETLTAEKPSINCSCLPVARVRWSCITFQLGSFRKQLRGLKAKTALSKLPHTPHISTLLSPGATLIAIAYTSCFLHARQPGCLIASLSDLVLSSSCFAFDKPFN